MKLIEVTSAGIGAIAKPILTVVNARLRCKNKINNIIEQGHRFIKRNIRPMLGIYSLETAGRIICEIEIMHMIRNRQVEEIQCALSEVEFINKIMGIAAWYSAEK
ncbi:MAG: integrase core domain protein [Firmicutes bacterium]|nr:integrase core domain protein [Bacillota bacterium]